MFQVPAWHRITVRVCRDQTASVSAASEIITVYYMATVASLLCQINRWIGRTATAIIHLLTYYWGCLRSIEYREIEELFLKFIPEQQ